MSSEDYLSEFEVATLTCETDPALQAVALARSGVPFIFSGSAVRVLRQAMKGRQMRPEECLPSAERQPN